MRCPGFLLFSVLSTAWCVELPDFEALELQEDELFAQEAALTNTNVGQEGPAAGAAGAAGTGQAAVLKQIAAMDERVEQANGLRTKAEQGGGWDEFFPQYEKAYEQNSAELERLQAALGETNRDSCPVPYSLPQNTDNSKGGGAVTTGKLAILFLVTTSISFEALWDAFLATCGTRCTVYVHSDKNPVFRLPRFNNALVANPVRTTWSILRDAELKLLSASLADDANTKFILVGPDSVPVKHPDAVLADLLSPRTPWSALCFGQPNHWARPDVPKEQAWFVLNRKHAALMVAPAQSKYDTDPNPGYRCRGAENECYFGKAFARLGLLPEVQDRCVMFVWWRQNSNTGGGVVPDNDRAPANLGMDCEMKYWKVNPKQDPKVHMETFPDRFRCAVPHWCRRREWRALGNLTRSFTREMQPGKPDQRPEEEWAPKGLPQVDHPGMFHNVSLQGLTELVHSEFAFARKFNANVTLSGGLPGGGRCGVGDAFESCLQHLIGLEPRI